MRTPETKQDLSGTLIRSIIQGGVEPAPLTLRAEVLEVVHECADNYGFGSPFVTEEYLRNRTPVYVDALSINHCSHGAAGSQKAAATSSKPESNPSQTKAFRNYLKTSHTILRRAQDERTRILNPLMVSLSPHNC